MMRHFCPVMHLVHFPHAVHITKEIAQKEAHVIAVSMEIGKVILLISAQSRRVSLRFDKVCKVLQRQGDDCSCD